MDNNTFALILAGGSGKRMGNPDKPKQFLMLGGKPILVHTIEKFCVAVEFRSVIVLCPDMWVRQTKDLVSRYLPHLDHIEVVAGGPVRNDTIMKGLDYIEKRYGMDDDTIVVTHDAGLSSAIASSRRTWPPWRSSMRATRWWRQRIPSWKAPTAR